MELKEIKRLSKVAADNIKKEAQMDEVVGTIAVESMGKALETGNVKVAEDALENFDKLVLVDGIKKEAKTKDFLKLLKTNPKSGELNKAFKLYESDTGKSRNDMTNANIDSYVKKIRVN